MKKNKVLQFVVIAFVGLLLANPVSAQPANLVVDFENTPLFSEANFLPGNEITRFAKVTNNTADTQQILVEAINITDPNSFGDILQIEIREGASVLYSNTLSTFFAAGQVPLSQLAGNATQTQYDFTVQFPDAGDNVYQEKSLGFDLLIGFAGINDSNPTTINQGGSSGSSGGGGGSTTSPSGLIIFDETVRILNITETSATIEWGTSYPSTSQVIYAQQGEVFALNVAAPNFGYPHAFPIPEDFTKVINHSVTISGLQPGTTYFFRAVSHASPPTISRGYSFQTVGVSSGIGQNGDDLPFPNFPEGLAGLQDGTFNNVPTIDSIQDFSELQKPITNNVPQIGESNAVAGDNALALPDESGTEKEGEFLAAVGFVGGLGVFGIIFASLGIFVLYVLSQKQRSKKEKK